MRDILPSSVLTAIGDHYRHAVADAEAGFVFNAVNEEAVSGALGQALLTFQPRTSFADGREFQWSVTHETIPSKGGGRGRGEKLYGGDVVLQLEVRDRNGRLLRRKALLAQAKKEWIGAMPKLLGQAQDMLRFSRCAIVINYRGNGYECVPASDVVAAKGNRKLIGNDKVQSLGHLLSTDFLECRRGDVGVFWNRKARQLQWDDGRAVPQMQPPEEVVTTQVQIG